MMNQPKGRGEWKRMNEVILLNTSLGKKVDTSGLKTIVDMLATQSTQLNDAEKSQAKEIIEEWINEIQRRMELKRQDTIRFLTVFSEETITPFHHAVANELFDEELADQTNTRIEYETYRDHLTKLREFEKEAPDFPILSLELTEGERLLQDSDFKLKRRKYQIVLAQLQRGADQSLKQWISVLAEHPSIQSLIHQGKLFKRTYKKTLKTCQKTAQDATLNLLISNDETRKALRQLVDYVEQI